MNPEIVPDGLPRQTFKSEADAMVELSIAECVAQWARAQYLKIGQDDPNKQKPRIDGLLHRDGRVVAFLEIKSCSYRYGERPEGWTTGEKKITSMLTLYSIVRVPVVMVVSFGCGTIAYTDNLAFYTRVEHFGRFDRNSPGDIEPGARFAWSSMKVILRGTVA